MLEIKEDIVKLKIEDVKLFTTTYASPAAERAAEIWKRKSVTNASPISKRKHQNEIDSGQIKNGQGFFSKLITDFKKAKIRPSDTADLESEVTKKIVDPVEKAEIAKGFVINKSLYNRDVLDDIKEDKEKSPSRKFSIVVQNKVNKLKLPDFYNGSQMYMPKGEQLFWVCFFFYFFVSM